MTRSKSIEADPELVKEAAYAVFERPGGEDLTQAEFHEEVLGLMRARSTAIEKQIDKLYRHIYGGALRVKTMKKTAKQLDSEIAEILDAAKVPQVTIRMVPSGAGFRAELVTSTGRVVSRTKVYGSEDTARYFAENNALMGSWRKKAQR